VPQWLFAFDAAGMATFRALALLAVHPDQAARARAELRSHPGIERQYLPFLRSTVLESLRLWPTTPAILRQSTRATQWEGGTMPEGTGILLFTPFFHRDDQRMDCADRFAPELWLKDDKVRDVQDRDWPLVPFSSGPVMCPARNLVLMLTSVMLGALIGGDDGIHGLTPSQQGRLDPARLPGTLDNYSLRFVVRADRDAGTTKSFD
jgi:cytochrome P450